MSASRPHGISPPTLRDPLPLASRYELLVKIASGGMASVYVGRLRGAVGFWRTVAVKRAHAHLLEQLEEVLLLVMDYVEGPEPRARAVRGARG